MLNQPDAVHAAVGLSGVWRCITHRLCMACGSGRELQPTGRVVAIVQRVEKAIVVCIADEDERALRDRGGADRAV